MRASKTANGVTVKAYAGTTGVLLAMNIKEAKRPGLLGFAIERRWKEAGKSHSGWLVNGICFDGAKLEKPFPSNEAPIQKFRWSDYCVYPDTEYTYIIHPVYGKPKNGEKVPQLDVQKGPRVTVTTHSTKTGRHQVVFNRAAAASQAFANKFGDIKLNAESTDDQFKERKTDQKADKEKEKEALAWLARGLLEKILDFIGRAENEDWALDIAIYEYELKAIIDAVTQARARKNGPRIRILYHFKAGDEQTDVNERSLATFPEKGKKARVTNNIFHDKFMVLSQKVNGRYQPQAVLCGSTNFTENGVYRQANVVHVIENSEIAEKYENIFETIWGGKKDIRNYIDKNNSLDIAIDDEPVTEEELVVGFSPRSMKGKTYADLSKFSEIIAHAHRDVLFCTAFDLHESIENALKGREKDPILRYGLQNASGRIEGTHADCTASFVTAALLPKGLEGWLQESTAGQEGNILVHTKMVVVDFTSDSPTVISGSHNFSDNASTKNDENYLIIRGNRDVADIYGCELMRLYEHYRFRFRVNQPPAAVEKTKDAVKAVKSAKSTEEALKVLQLAAQEIVNEAKATAEDAEQAAQRSVMEVRRAAKDARMSEAVLNALDKAALQAQRLENLSKAAKAAKSANSPGEITVALERALQAAKDAALSAKNADKAKQSAESVLIAHSFNDALVKTLQKAAEYLEAASAATARAKQKKISLFTSDHWTEKYFIGFKSSDPLKIRDRECFSGAKVTPYEELLKITA